jgi:uncharacterized membrane protein YhaH (DUF805 family)
MEEPRSRIYFLFRSDAGRIDAATWWRGTLLLVGIFAVLTFGWHLIEPYADHGLNATLLFTVGILFANLYRLVYGFALILILISYYNLSAKRWRDIGRPAALAGLLPLFAWIAGAVHWLEPRLNPEMPHAIPIAANIVLVAILIWNVVELGGLHLQPAKEN